MKKIIIIIFCILIALLASACIDESPEDYSSSDTQCEFDCGHKIDSSYDYETDTCYAVDYCPECSFNSGYEHALDCVMEVGDSINGVVFNPDIVYEILSKHYPDDDVYLIVEEMYATKGCSLSLGDLYENID